MIKINLMDTLKGLSWRVVKGKSFNWPIFSVAVITLCALIFLSGCGFIDMVLPGLSKPGEDSAGEVIEVANPLNELQDVLILTDVQLETLKTGTGTLKFRDDQVELFSGQLRELLVEVDYLFEGALRKEAEVTLTRLLEEGVADIDSLHRLTGELYHKGFEYEPLVGTVHTGTFIRLEKLSSYISASQDSQNQATTTTIYTPMGSAEGEGKFTLSDLAGLKLGPGDINYEANVNIASGGVFASSTSWIGSDAALALVGISFEVPQDNTYVEIAVDMQHISAATERGLAVSFAGTHLAVDFDGRLEEQYETVINPLTWKKGVEVILTVLAPFAPLPKGVLVTAKVAEEAVSSALDSIDLRNLALAMQNIEGVEESSLECFPGYLDKGTYQFFVGVNAKTSAMVINFSHAAILGQVNEIRVIMQAPAEPGPETKPDISGGYYICPHCGKIAQATEAWPVEGAGWLQCSDCAPEHVRAWWEETYGPWYHPQ